MLHSLVFKENRSLRALGSWFTWSFSLSHARNRIDGVVITFVDIMSPKKAGGRTARKRTKYEMPLHYFPWLLVCLSRSSIHPALRHNAGLSTLMSLRTPITVPIEKSTGTEPDDTCQTGRAGRSPGRYGSDAFQPVPIETGKQEYCQCRVYRPGDNQARLCLLLEEHA